MKTRPNYRPVNPTAHWERPPLALETVSVCPPLSPTHPAPGGSGSLPTGDTGRPPLPRPRSPPRDRRELDPTAPKSAQPASLSPTSPAGCGNDGPGCPVPRPPPPPGPGSTSGVPPWGSHRSPVAPPTHTHTHTEDHPTPRAPGVGPEKRPSPEHHNPARPTTCSV